MRYNYCLCEVGGKLNSRLSDYVICTVEAHISHMYQYDTYVPYCQMLLKVDAVCQAVILYKGIQQMSNSLLQSCIVQKPLCLWIDFLSLLESVIYIEYCKCNLGFSFL